LVSEYGYQQGSYREIGDENTRAKRRNVEDEYGVATFTIVDTAPIFAHEPCGQGSSSREG
jgi:hypothetical protein